jgi:hypothetical protein
VTRAIGGGQKMMTHYNPKAVIARLERAIQ